MSLFRTVHRSPQCATALDSPCVGSILGFLCPSIDDGIYFGLKTLRKGQSHFPILHSSRYLYNSLSAERVFVQALLEAGTCRNRNLSIRIPSKRARYPVILPSQLPFQPLRNYSTVAPTPELDDDHDTGYYQPKFQEPAVDSAHGHAINELKKLVLIYDVDPDDYNIVPNLKTEEPLQMPSIPEGVGDNDEAAGTEYLSDILDDPESLNGDIFAVYQLLVNGREFLLPRPLIDKLLRRFSRVTQEEETQVVRYFTVLDYLKFRGFPLTPIQWNNAMRFASRSNRGRSDAGLDSAMYLWKQMEEDSGVAASYSTFNILIHAAMLSQRWTLTEKLIQEMDHRGHRLDRYFHHTRITYYGARYGPSAVRLAYNQYVDGGYIVATDILNTVIRSFINTGEIAAAEHVFDRMKMMAAKLPEPSYFPHGYAQSRMFFQKLNDFDTLKKATPEEKQMIQNSVPIGPNMHTYGILIKGHSLKHGNINRCLELIYEMKAANLQPSIPIFFNLVKGFRIHFNGPEEGWTSDKLEALWLGFLRSAIAGRIEGLSMSGPLAYVVVTAFYKCCGKDRALEVLDEIGARWEIDPQILEMIWTQMG